MNAITASRTFTFEDAAAHASWRLIVVRENDTSTGYGFSDEKAARAGASAYALSPDTRGVWVERVGGAR